MRRLTASLLAALTLLALTAAMAIPALAGNSGDGSDYGTQPGFTTSLEQTPCAGHGAFGKDYNMAGGADGTQPGISNSNLRGNTQRPVK